MRKPSPKTLIPIGLGIFFYAVTSFTNLVKAPAAPVATPGSSSNQSVLGEATGSARVTRVVDEDTFEVSENGQTEKVRYIGIDTPETVDPHRPVGCFGKEASDEDKRILTGQTVILEKDVEDKDQFGRLLRYVYINTGEGTFFANDYLLREGFARVDTIAPNTKFVARFTSAQAEAQKNLRGLWSPSTCNGQK